MQALLDGAAAVIHCAAAVRGNNRDDFRHSNVDGTRALIAAALAQAKRPQLLLLSSLAAREPQLSWYAQSKHDSEHCLRRMGSGLDWTILRPPPVYGVGDREMRPLFRSMSRGFAPLAGSPTARTSLLHIDDLTGACIACLNSPGAQQVLPLCDGRPNGYDWPELAAIAAAVWQRPVRLLRLPRWLFNSFARCNLYLARCSGRAAMLTPHKLAELRHPDWTCDNRAITLATQWQPDIDLRTGLQTLDI